MYQIVFFINLAMYYLKYSEMLLRKIVVNQKNKTMKHFKKASLFAMIAAIGIATYITGCKKNEVQEVSSAIQTN